MISDIMNSMIPVSRFNKGETGKIFKEVQKSGIKIAVKNNRPECVLVSPAQYDRIVETVEDYILYMQAEERLKNRNSEGDRTESELMRELGIDESDMVRCEADIEID